LYFVQDNATLQATTSEKAPDDDTTTAQKVFADQVKTVKATNTTEPLSALVQVLELEIGISAGSTPNSMAALTSFAKSCYRSGTIAIAQVYSGNPIAYNSAVVECTSADTANVYWQGGALEIGEMIEADFTVGRVQICNSNACVSDVQDLSNRAIDAMEVFSLYTVAAVAHATNTPLLVPGPLVRISSIVNTDHYFCVAVFASSGPRQIRVPHHWLGTPTPAAQKKGFRGFANAMAGYDKLLKGMLSAFQGIASAFGTKSTTRIIGEQSCLGFNSFHDNISTNIVQCLADDHGSFFALFLLSSLFPTSALFLLSSLCPTSALFLLSSLCPTSVVHGICFIVAVDDFVNDYFADLSWAFNGSMSQINAEITLMKYAQGLNFSSDHLNITNTGSSVVRELKIFKNHDSTNLNCSHWVLSDYTGCFTLAPDLIMWEKSSSAWLGLKTSDETYIQKVPHKLSPDDIHAIGS
jgi:hypothetical protein